MSLTMGSGPQIWGPPLVLFTNEHPAPSSVLDMDINSVE